MKAKVIIEDGETNIDLIPQTEFERDLIEKIHSRKDSYKTLTEISCEYKYHTYANHKIVISIKEIR